jgi:hypothetical protein
MKTKLSNPNSELRRRAVNASESRVEKVNPAGVPVAEIVWAVLTIGSLAMLLRCLAC